MLNLSKSSSRIKDFNGSHIFENVICYDCNQLESPTLQWLFPPHLDDKLKTIIPEFALPVPHSSYSPKHNGFIDYTKSSSNTQDLQIPYTYHAFALTTDECGHLLFGFCHMSHNVLLVILSYRPWYTPFYKLLTQLSGSFIEGSFDNDSYSFLTKIYQHPYKVLDGENDKEYNQIREGKFSFIYKNPDLLDNPLSDGVPAIIPTNRQFTELYNCLSSSNLITAWTSMLYERRVILVSSKLNRLSSVALSLLYLLFPLQWQHIFIPILPQKLIETVAAPIPFLIGLPRHVYESTEFAQSTRQLLNECAGENVVTIVDLDSDRCTFYDANLQNPSQHQGPTCNQVPAFVIANLKKRLLPKFSSPSATVLPGSIHIGEAFLLAMVDLVGDYRNGLAFEPGTEISFQPDTLLRACRPSAKTCLEQILKTQMFEQFISERLRLLNSGYGFDDVFEREVNIGETENNKFSQMQKYKDWLGYMKSEGDFYLKSLKSRTSSTSVTLLKNVPTLDWAYSNMKSKGKSAYNMVRLLKPFNNNASSQTVKKAREILHEKGTEFYCDFIKNDLTPNGQNGIIGHSATQPKRSGVVRNFSKAVAESKSLPYNWKSGRHSLGPNDVYGGTSKESSTFENKRENGMVLIPQDTPDRQMGLDRDPHLPSNQNFANGTNQPRVNGSNACNGLPKLPSPQNKPRRRHCRKAVAQSLIDLDSTPSGPDLGRLAADRLLEEFGNIDFNDYKDSPNAKNVHCLPNITRSAQNGIYQNSSNPTPKPSLNGYNPVPNVTGRLNGLANGHSTEANSTVPMDYLTTLLPNHRIGHSQAKQYQQSWETFD